MVFVPNIGEKYYIRSSVSGPYPFAVKYFVQNERFECQGIFKGKNELVIFQKYGMCILSIETVKFGLKDTLLIQ